MNTNKKCEDNQPERKRGRPSGRNRVPLSMEERRARNAQYERERRDGTAEAMGLLAEAAGCPLNMPNKLILQTARDLLARHNTTIQAIEVLRRTNEAFIEQIENLENFLARAAKGKKVKKAKKKEKSLGLREAFTKRSNKIVKIKTLSNGTTSSSSETGEEFLQHASLEPIAEIEVHTESLRHESPCQV